MNNLRLHSGLMDPLFAKYRALARNRDKFGLMMSPDPGDGRQLEYYPPWESENPMPGKATVELYNQSGSPAETQNLIAGDMLHYLGSVDPTNNQPIDPTFQKLKQQLIQSRVPGQVANDQEAYNMELPYYGANPPSMEDYMQDNRGDAYIRGKLTPDAADEWKRMYTPDQNQILELLRQYITRGSIAPGMNR